MVKIGIILGTRPEALKLIPVLLALKGCFKDIKTYVISTGQHRELLQQVLNLFDIEVDVSLEVMRENQTLSELSVSVLSKVSEAISEIKLDRVIVQGDTTTAFVASLASMYLKIPVCHIEAGLRSYNRSFPWPEEFNRRAVALVSDMHFAPTKKAESNLLAEKIEGNIFVTGNTVIDMLFIGLKRIENDPALFTNLENKFSLPADKKLVLVTCHRREYFQGFRNICDSLIELAKREDVYIIFSVHPNPNIHDVAHDMLSDLKNVSLLPPQDYLEFIYLMQKSYLILSDSGGIQEEAPYLGKRVFVLRNETERPEALSTGYVRLVGCNKEIILQYVNESLDNDSLPSAPDISKLPFGDGTAGKKVVNIIRESYGL